MVLTEADLDAMAEKLCASPLPDSVSADLRASRKEFGGTDEHLLSLNDAKEMLRHALSDMFVIQP